MKICLVNMFPKWKDKNSEYTGSMMADPLGNDVSESFEDIYHIGVVKKEKIKQVREMIPLRPSFRPEYKVKKINN